MSTIREIVNNGLQQIMKSRGGYRSQKVDDFVLLLENREALKQKWTADQLKVVAETWSGYYESWAMKSTNRITQVEKERDAAKLELIAVEEELRDVKQERDQLQQELDDNGVLDLELRDLKQDLKSKSAHIKHLEGLQDS